MTFTHISQRYSFGETLLDSFKKFDPLKDMGFVGGVYFISANVQMNDILVNLYLIPSKSFDLFENMTTLEMLILIILASGVIQALMDL